MSKKGGHHGGAWKVAYADFVTAMMALFMVLWLTSQDQRIKEAVERAFTNPFSSVTKESVGIIEQKEKTSATKSTTGNFDSASAVELKMLRQINQDLIKSLHTDDENGNENPVKLELTDNGLCINVLDRANKPIFEHQSTKLTIYGEWVFNTLAWEIARYTSFAIELEGHTEKGNPPLREDYGDWELSVDRANTVRRKLTENGVSIHQVRKVAGYGDTVPMPNEEPTAEINRRVTVLLNVRQQTKNNELARHD